MPDNYSLSTTDWQAYWKNNPQLLSSFPDHLESYQLPMYRVLKGMLSGQSNAKVLSAGSGQDIISCQLQRDFGGHLSFTLLDISPEVLAWNKQLFDRDHYPVTTVVGDLFQMPLPDNNFDIAFNTGVLEHFTAQGQIAMVREILRVLKPGGYFVTANPSASGRIYRWGMAQGKRRGVWPFGEETPIESLLFLKNEIVEIDQIDEWQQDFLTQLNFLSYVDRRLRFLTWPLRCLGRWPVVAEFYDRWLGPIWGTYLLISIFKKRS